MTVRAALYDYLTTALAAEVSDRVYANKAPEGATLPYVRYARVSASRDYFHEVFTDTLPWVSERFQFDCTAITPVGAEDLGDALIDALSGYGGSMEGVDIGDVRVVNDLDRYDPETKLYRRIIDVLVEHEEIPVAS